MCSKAVWHITTTLFIFSVFFLSQAYAKSTKYTATRSVSKVSTLRSHRLSATTLKGLRKDWTPQEIVKSFTFTKVRAWQRPDGAYRYDIVVKNNSPKDFASAMGSVHVQRYKLDGTRWKPAGGHAIQSLASQKTFDLLDLPWDGQNASKFRVILRWNSVEYASQTVTLGDEPDKYKDPLEMTAREILGSITYSTFSASVDVNGRAIYNIAVHNNTKHAFTSQMKRLTLHIMQGGVPISYKHISPIPPNGTVSFLNKQFTDQGGNNMNIYLNYDKHPWQRKTIAITGAAARDARAQAILKKIRIESLSAHMKNGGKAEFIVTLRNTSKWSFNRIGHIQIQTYVLVNNRWKPSGGWSISRVMAGKTATLKQGFDYKNGSKLKVKVRLKGKVYTEKDCPFS